MSMQLLKNQKTNYWSTFKKKGIPLAFLCCWLGSLYGQATKDTSYFEMSPKPHRVIGFNMTPLLVQLIPFNRSNPTQTGPFYIAFRKYNKTNTAFRFGLGLDINPIGDVQAIDSYLNLRIGWQKQKVISGRWAYYGGMDLMLIAGDLNLPQSKSEDEGAIGIAPIWGIEYALTEQIRLSTELALFLGLSSGRFEILPRFEFIPPVSIFLNFKLPPKKKRHRRDL